MHVIKRIAAIFKGERWVVNRLNFLPDKTILDIVDVTTSSTNDSYFDIFMLILEYVRLSES